MCDDLLQNDLFRPLAARMRPNNLDSFFGQKHLIGRGKPLREAIDNGVLHSMIFWGPPGVGKTTLARLIARSTDAYFENISAVLSGVKEIRAAIANAKEQRDLQAKKLFYSLTRCIDLINLSKMLSCLLSKMAPWCLLAPQRKIHLLS